MFTAVAAVAIAGCARVASASTHEYVVGLWAGERGFSSAGTSALDIRLASLGARLGRGLADSIAIDTTSFGPDMFIGPKPRSPLAFDPTRVGLIEAADSAAAANVALRLVREGAIEWAEPLESREPADAFTWPPPARTATTLTSPPDFPNDPLFREGRQWGLENRGAASGGGIAGADVHARSAWQRSRGANWVRLAITDTGIDPAHPDLQRALADGPRITQGLNVTGEPGGSWADSAAHGTAVAGVMAALTGDGAHFDSLGTAGVCGGDGGANYGCHIVPLKIAQGHNTYASSFDLARGIVAAVAAGARAVNVSYGGGAPSRVEREAMRYAMERGCLVVAASGNQGASTPTAPIYPAAYSADRLCLQVGASDAWDHRAVFSSYGPGLDLVAPGTGIWTTFLTYPSAAGAIYPGYVAVSGTSFAAPFATGAAGLLAAARPELFADDLRELLRGTARDIGAPGADVETAAGVLDAAAALQGVDANTGIWHDEVAADTWSATGLDSLVCGENGPGNLTGPHTWPRALRIEASVTIALPDSFEDGARVWPRVAGTSTVRGDFRIPYFAPRAEVVWTGPRVFRLRGWLYRVAADGDSLDLPLPFDQARFGFTVLGRVRRPRLDRGDATTPAPSLHAAPNPFAAALRIERPADATIELFDVRGRRVRGWGPNGSLAPIVWDGRDTAGRRTPPGLYWVRARTAQGVRVLRVTKLE